MCTCSTDTFIIYISKTICCVSSDLYVAGYALWYILAKLESIYGGCVTALPAKYFRGSQEVLRPRGFYCNYHLSSSCAV